MIYEFPCYPVVLHLSMTAIQTSRQTDFVFNGSFLQKEGARYISFQTVLSSQYMTRQTIKQTNCKAPCIIDAWLIGFFFSDVCEGRR